MKQTGIYTIEEIKNKLAPIFEERGVIKAVLFGSYAKNEATEDSDVDMVVHVDEEMSILDFAEIADVVINRLGKEVDFLYADDIIPGGRIDLELREGGVIIYDKY
ncbi:MAG: nucleotidyltransferase domain-containing protein [Defluviitaleaceae bacterium]|nr:nucleotidyltransferase domain-containing protein [Defluviitaleaceae bacterium]